MECMLEAKIHKRSYRVWLYQEPCVYCFKVCTQSIRPAVKVGREHNHPTSGCLSTPGRSFSPFTGKQLKVTRERHLFLIWAIDVVIGAMSRACIAIQLTSAPHPDLKSHDCILLSPGARDVNDLGNITGLASDDSIFQEILANYEVERYIRSAKNIIVNFECFIALLLKKISISLCCLRQTGENRPFQVILWKWILSTTFLPMPSEGILVMIIFCKINCWN